MEHSIHEIPLDRSLSFRNRDLYMCRLGQSYCEIVLTSSGIRYFACDFDFVLQSRRKRDFFCGYRTYSQFTNLPNRRTTRIQVGDVCPKNPGEGE